MEKTRWQLIDEFFEKALEQSGDQREQFLAGLDPALRQELESLLAADVAARTFLEARSGLSRTTTESPAAPEDFEPPGRIGPYKVLGVLGEGGMGRVLLAARADEEYQRLVAIKTLRARLRGPLREELLARFDLERQALAQLEHPNIARLYDAGRDENGDPYLVIEHIDGLPIDAYCDEKKLDVPARLRLFLEVCQAVQVAHKNLLVHRDLKPSNILVTREGRPMLLDFGIAKLLDPARIAGEVLETREGSRPMTPGYASPEQVKGEPITTASDVYSLGVLLYELLTGRKPYRVTSWLPHELEKAICEVEPERPSTAVFRDPAKEDTQSRLDSPLAPSEVAERRQTTPSGLARALRGDLDTLLQAALRKNPDHRYPSVEALSQDIHAFLDGRPLAARRSSRFYALRKFVRRHRFGVVAAALLTVLLFGFVGALMVQARQIRAERDKAEKALDFLVEVFKASDPNRAQGEELKAREILDGAARRVESELAGQPEIQATLMDAMGQVYFSLGLFDEAQHLFEKALTLRIRELGEKNPETLETRARFGRTLLAKDQVAEARAQIEKVFADRDPEAPEDEKLGEYWSDLAAVEDAEKAAQGGGAVDSPEALEARRRAAAIYEATGASFAKQTAARAHLINLLLRNRLFDELNPLMEQMGRESTLLLETDVANLEIAHSFFSVGDLLGQFGDRRAEPLLRRAVEIRNKFLPANHQGIFEAEATLAFFLAFEERYEESTPMYRRLYERALEQFGPEHRMTLERDYAYAIALAQIGQHAEALPRFENTFERLQKLEPDGSPRMAMAWMSRGGLHRMAGHYEVADRYYREAQIRQRQLTPEQFDPAFLEVGFARLRRDQKDYPNSITHYRQGLELRRARLGEGDWQYGFFLGEFAGVLVEAGHFDEAEKTGIRSYNLLRRFYGPETVMVVKPLKALLALYEKQGRQEEAVKIRAAIDDPGQRPQEIPSPGPLVQ